MIRYTKIIQDYFFGSVEDFMMRQAKDVKHLPHIESVYLSSVQKLMQYKNLTVKEFVKLHASGNIKMTIKSDKKIRKEIREFLTSVLQHLPRDAQEQIIAINTYLISLDNSKA